MKFGVIGAGVVGLNTALQLQESFPESQVTILADKFGTEISNFYEVGVFRPSTSFCGHDIVVTRKWIKDAFDHWNSICKSSEGSLAGVAQLSVYQFSSTNPEAVKNSYLENVLPVYRPATDAELQILPGEWKYGSYFITLITDYTVFYPWAKKKFLSNGGMIKQVLVTDFRNLEGQYDVIVNCTGIGSKTLCNDTNIIPVRNSFIRVKALWLKTGFYGDDDTVVVPGFRGEAQIGNISQHNNSSSNVIPSEMETIKSKCSALVPSLQKSPTIGEYVAVHSQRDVARVEYENVPTKNGKMHVIHNYGHGSNGKMVSPGTAKHVVDIIKTLF